MYRTDPPKPAKETLPTMYDLKSEDPEEPGLPDEFHDFQPQLLRETFQSSAYGEEERFMGTDINLYYDTRHPLWYKRPDWFLVLGVAGSTQQQEMRLSYVLWQESVPPYLVVELLSPGTEAEDLRQSIRAVGKPPTKWEVYERILRVPYYVVFDRYENKVRGFRLEGTRYQELDQSDPGIWFEEVQLGLGVWQGSYQGVTGQWLRWCQRSGDWILTAAERAERLADRLRELGVDPDEYQ